MKGEGKNLFVIYLKCIVPFRKFWTMDRIEFSKDRNLSQYTLHHFTREVTSGSPEGRILVCPAGIFNKYSFLVLSLFNLSNIISVA